MNIGIIFGGKSFEHDISIISAYQLKKRIEDKYNIHLIYVDMNNDLFIADKLLLNDFKNSNLKKLKKTRFINGGLKGINIDVIVSVMHGENGEDGLCYGLCKFYNIKFLGCSLFSSSLCIDKYLCYNFLKSNNINVIDTMLYSYKDYLNGIEVKFMPCIIKPSCLGSSIGINVCMKEEDLDNKLINSFEYSDNVIIQPYYDNLLEYNLALNEYEYSNLEFINKKDEIFSFENKYNDSFKQIHQHLVDDTKYKDFCDISRKIYNLIDADGIIRIDFFVKDDKIIVNEINTTPGALAMYLFSDFDRVFSDSLKKVLSELDIEYVKGDFLTKSSINK